MSIDFTGNPVLGVIVVVVALGIFIFIQYKKKSFKTTDLTPLIESAFPECKYDPTGILTKEEYEEIGCLSVGGHLYGEDLLFARTESGTAFRYCEINTYNTYRVNGVESRDVKFSGAIISFDNKDDIDGCFYIVSKTYKAKTYFHRKILIGIDKTGTENVLFDKHFLLYTNNLTRAYVLLKPQNLEKLIAIKEKYKNLIIAFNAGKVHILLPNVDLFKAPTFNFGNKNKEAFCKDCCRDLEYLVNVINDFNYLED